MQFCTLDEAWGNSKYISENFEDSPINDKPKKKEINKKETFKNVKFADPVMTDESLVETFTETINDKQERDKLLRKVLKSKRCRNILRKKFRPPLVEKLNNMLEDYKDVIVMILIGFSIIIFFNLVRNLSKSN